MAQRILFAEDEAPIRELVCEILRQEGYIILEAQSGDEAALIFDAEDVDVLVTDVRMPGSKDGLDLAAYARQANPTLPIVVMTGFADQVGSRVRALGRSVTLLHKPFPATELLGALATSAQDA